MTWEIDYGRDSERTMLAARRRLRGDPRFTQGATNMTEMRIKKNDMPVSDVEMGETHGTGTFINWKRLNEALRKSGILSPNEYVKGVNINAAGFGIYIGSNNDPESDLYEKPLGD